MKNEDCWSVKKYVTSVISLVIVTITLTIGSCGLYTDYRIAKAIEQGNDPILSRLAFSDSGCSERLLYIANKEK